MNISGLVLKFFGWKVEVTVPDYPKCVICVAPHTSNWDFVLGKLAYASINRKAGFLMKEAWFFFPFGIFFRAIGGIPVPKQKGSELTESIVNKFKDEPRMAIAVTPEGTRKRTSKWRTGFLYISLGANIPIVLGTINYPTKNIKLTDTFYPTGDIDADMKYIKNYYKDFKGKFADRFTTT
ncbi:MAG: 1-acyl-sn-glycerol-3-phosphate acyltransferase [Muribaculaceae bacterium]